MELEGYWVFRVNYLGGHGFYFAVGLSGGSPGCPYQGGG